MKHRRLNKKAMACYDYNAAEAVLGDNSQGPRPTICRCSNTSLDASEWNRMESEEYEDLVMESIE